MKKIVPDSIILQMAAITTESVKACNMRALRPFVGEDSPYRLPEISQLVQSDPRTFRSYLSGENAIAPVVRAKLEILLGPDFANAILQHSGMHGARIITPEKVSDFELNGSTAQLMGKIGAALSDGHCDHKERPHVVAAAKELMAILQSWLSIHGGMQ